MTNRFSTKFASAVLAICESTVSFAEVTRAETVEFSYSPVELATDDRAAEIDKRIRNFSRSACRTGSPIQTPRSLRECREDLEVQLRTAIWQVED